jgi:hypothetical protein
MGMQFEWASPTGASDGCVYGTEELAEVSEDGAQAREIGISLDTGSNGIMIYGQRQELILWLAGMLARLKAGEGVEIDRDLGPGEPASERLEDGDKD